MNSTNVQVLAFAAVLATAGCVEIDEPNRRGSTLDTHGIDQVLAVVIDTSGSFDDDWEREAYRFMTDLVDSYFQQSLGSKSVLQVAVLSERRDPVFWIASPRDFARAFPNEQAFSDRLRAEKQTEFSPIFGSVAATIESVQATAGLRPDSKATVVVLSDLRDSTPNTDSKTEAKRMVDAIEEFANDGGNIAFYYVHSRIAGMLRAGLDKRRVDSSRFWIESENVFAPTPPTFH